MTQKHQPTYPFAPGVIDGPHPAHHLYSAAWESPYTLRDLARALLLVGAMAGAVCLIVRWLA